jgi:hypothetical protein
MGYYGINILIKRKDNNMINELKEVSLKSLDMIVKNADGLNKLAEIMNSMQENMNLMATKVLELEEKQKRTVEELSKYERSASN